MRAIIYFKDFLVLVGGVSLIVLSFDAYNFLFPSKSEPQADLFDWSVVGEYPNPDKSVVAVLERGVSNTGANTAPFYHIELRTAENSNEWRNHWMVWNSQVRQPPGIKWLDHNNIEIKQVSYRVWEYEPSVELNGNTYGVHLNVLPTKP
jgi:hypothetical protein